jgi:hypothetical protein
MVALQYKSITKFTVNLQYIHIVHIVPDRPGLKMFHFGAAAVSSLLLVASAAGAAIPTPADYLSNLTKYGYKDTLYAGFMPFSFEDDNDGSLFFWYNPQRPELVIPGKERFIIWMNGGPGCSSVFGSMGENGPLEMQWEEPYTDFKTNPYSWNNVAHVLYLEIPLRKFNDLFITKKELTIHNKHKKNESV